MPHNLPPIQVYGDRISDIYTHRSYRRDDSPGHTLAFLGERLLNFAIACHWYEKSPSISQQELQEKQEQSLSDDLLQDCIEQYELHPKLARHDEDISLEDCRDFLNIYIGALFVQDGTSGVQRWVAALIDPTAEPVSNAPLDGTTVELPASPEASTIVPSPSPSTQTLPPYSTDDLSFVTLSLFNEYATQRQNYTVTWEAVHSGDAHRLAWTVKCLLNGEVKGTGVASSQKIAKERAARDVCQTMDWGGSIMASTASAVGSSQAQPPSRALSPLPPLMAPLPDLSALSVSSGGSALDYVTVSRFNESAMQKGYRVEWESKATGQPHMPTWQVTCIVDGHPRGIGSGRNTKEAKQHAVRDAWKNMHW